MDLRVRWLTEVSLLAAFITVTGAMKLPGLLPGTEFQLSAPLAVAICAAFGFPKYIIAGFLSSTIGLILGTQTIFNVFIAMVFRLVVGGILGIFGRSWPVIVIAGPLGSATARLAMGGLLGKAVIPLVMAAVPGMIYTAILAWPLTQVLKRVQDHSARALKHVVQR